MLLINRRTEVIEIEEQSHIEAKLKPNIPKLKRKWKPKKYEVS